ncbi:MAG: epoxyqueuosine reductase QueH [Candidatus Rifleibacteriota bacterium]
MSILVHACCGPCLGGSIDTLKEAAKTEKIETFWFNPNIHPYLEYRDRMLSFRKICSDLKLKMHSAMTEYGLQAFLTETKNDFSEARCAKCYKLRLEAAAAFAAKNSFSAFTTTLLISPHQNHNLIVKTAQQAAEKFNTRFLYLDFRPDFKKTYEAIRKHELYKQRYCGCIFSEYVRFQNDKRYKLPEI